MRLFKRKRRDDDPIQCSNCGERAPDGAIECAMCGRRLVEDPINAEHARARDARERLRS
jgi:hypothetical protein